ncbi:HEAT repeat domain-containing protein [Myroides odoratimimus]|uniref:HEAT repeat domain-containing protein n=1 Tax=Myroides TaxID=76831 RepID=UPI00103C54A8|nr:MULTISPECIES: HEAT repeat domain-containing protein [Myroides]MDM1059765.1 HEAT repeat domain-containing protein [Myroides odoratimimus]MDM1064813.1 HEAT repeat domain-containing protein [Myroides odoratimimus]MDM1086687.1 HEAT repeat domain-containing protein [Myroides odoratimimus]MDM1093733.1 HEAT repeat domain-containing protein [Myroides odoratimimus]MDM1097820.1 HEAT repeat domain-containing protein [Myroides odoratimimus]
MEYNTNNYNEILKALDLPNYWENRLKSKVNKKSVHSLRMLEHLGDNVSGTAIAQKLYSENTHIRKHAKSIFMKFSSHDSFKFLENDFDRDFNAFDEVRIHTSLVKRASTRPLPLLMRWVNVAKNDKYQAFLIYEIAFFKQVESAADLLRLYKQTNSTVVKKAIVEALGDFAYRDAISVFIEEFSYVEQLIQNEIVIAFGKIGGIDALSFLEQLYYETENKELLVNILSTLYLLDKSKVTYNKIKEQAITDFERQIIGYVELR